MNITKSDIIVICVGLIATVLGFVLDLHGLSFSGGSLLGGFIFKLGYTWEGPKGL